MMNEQISSIIRSVLKYAGGYLTAKGVTDSSTAETVIAGIVALIGIVWSYYTHAATPSTPTK